MQRQTAAIRIGERKFVPRSVALASSRRQQRNFLFDAPLHGGRRRHATSTLSATASRAFGSFLTPAALSVPWVAASPSWQHRVRVLPRLSRAAARAVPSALLPAALSPTALPKGLAAGA
jgi:hypothetical protein